MARSIEEEERCFREEVSELREKFKRKAMGRGAAHWLKSAVSLMNAGVSSPWTTRHYVQEFVDEYRTIGEFSVRPAGIPKSG